MYKTETPDFKTGAVWQFSAEDVTTPTEWVHCVNVLLMIANALFLAWGEKA